MNGVFHFLAIAFLSFSILTKALAQPIVYVAEGAVGDGSSWANARGDLKAAIGEASNGAQVWVKKGAYYPTSCSPCGAADRDKSFEIPSGIQLFGGFEGTETSVYQRDIASHPTVLSGDIDRDGTLLNNSFSVVYTHDVSNQTVVDGFVITGGNADQTAETGSRQSSGTGWYNLGNTPGGSSHPVVVNCVFSNNYAWGHGAGMFNDGTFSGSCHPSLSNCTFSGNISRNKGAAMFNDGSFNGRCRPVLLGCVFEDNRSGSSDGGAVYNIGAEGGDCNPSFSNCVFTGNVAEAEGGAVFNFGKNGTCSPVFTDCLFENNEAILGGAIYDDGTFSGVCNPVFRGCHFIANYSSSDGGAMYNSGFFGQSNPALVNCRFERNRSGFAGGAIFTNGISGISNPVLTNCRFEKNMADTYGGAMYNQGKTGNASPVITNCVFDSNTALSAGAIYNLGTENGNANAVLTNCTFYGNHANVGGAVYCNAGEGGTGTSSPTIRNSIFWNNTATDEGDIFRVIWGAPNISFSLVDKNGCSGLYNGLSGSVACGPGMVYNQNPMFVDPQAANFHLSDGSPAIDDGSNDAISQANVVVDLDSLPRIFNNTVDMGVYEFGSFTGQAPMIGQHPQGLEACLGSTATFTVGATGSQPLSYQWLKNDIPIPNATLPSYTIQAVSFADGALYKCAVTNLTGIAVVSQAAGLTVQAPVSASVTIGAPSLEICAGEELTFLAEPVNGGGAPAFQWKLNGAPVGFNAPGFSTTVLTDQSEVYCELTSSLACVSENPAVSNVLVVSVGNCTAASEGQLPDKVEIIVQPNPNSGRFIVETKNLSGTFAIRLSNAQGQVLPSTVEEHPKIPDYRAVDLTNFPTGIYYLQIISDRLFTVKIFKVD